ncbi:MAG: hypothetical protein JW993_18365 [Sedimentisphaerales bacterium]|nr:hypothetical protein [Sedimentisphaerales bacterium]
MARTKDYIIGRNVVAGVVVALIIIVAGCRSTPAMRPAELPANVQVVGGGVMINWEAPADGTVYLVDKTSGKVIVTQTVEQGDPYEFELDPEDGAEAFKAVTGVELEDARLVLYFKPAQ